MSEKENEYFSKDYDVYQRARERLAEHLFGDTKNLPDFNEALKILNIEDYKDRIWNSNSRGELGHTFMYCEMAAKFKGTYMAEMFRPIFESMVKYAERHWERPESVFQHMDRMIFEWATQIKGKSK